MAPPSGFIPATEQIFSHPIVRASVDHPLAKRVFAA